MKKYKVLISGGGTGGHIFPAIAIANEIKKNYPDSNIEFVGAKGRMEMEKVPAAGFRIHGLWISGLQRRLALVNLLLPFKLISSLWNSFWIIKRFKPDFTVGVGGYASGPLNYVASLLGIPVFLQEQNSFPGITNKLLKNKAKKICVAYDGMERFFPADRVVITGNPIRQDIIDGKPGRKESLKYFSLADDKTTILVVGGSLGARTINEAVEHNLEGFSEMGVQLLWQTGKNYQGEFGSFEWGNRTPFIKEMDKAYACADIVISRAGAMSVSELSALGKAVIFIPSPFVAEDHQTKNAMNLVSKGAALLCEDRIAKEDLLEKVRSILSDPQKQEELEQAITKLARPEAAGHIVKEIINAIEN